MFDIKKLKKAQEGDLNCIEEICSATWEPLYRYVYFKISNREEAEDITQEAYVKAFSYSKRKIIDYDNYIAFLKTIALNIIRDRWRKNKRQGGKVNIESINPVETAVEDSTEASTQRMLVESALDRLNEEQRMVVELRILKGFSVSETAKIMNKKESTIRVLQYRTLKNLAQILKYGE